MLRTHTGRVDRATQPGRDMNGQDVFAGIRNLTIDLAEYSTGGLGSGRDGGTHGFKAVIKLIGSDFGGIDLAFWKLDIQRGLDDAQ
jgi:hypothetical protein